jgi:hypothetical protein
MDTQRSPRVFISYSHDSSEHEERVLALCNRLRADGIDATIDRYESSPPEGWPLWMERELIEAEFVLVVCTKTYLRRIMHKEEPQVGLGVIWEGATIRNLLYSDGMETSKFLPVLFDGAQADDIPLPLRGPSRFQLDRDYESLYRCLTHQPLVSKPALGRLRSLPAKEKSPDSLPNAFSLEQLSKTMSNPRYADDIFKLDRIYDRHSVINKETIIIVVGTTIVTELLDRPAAELLRDHIDQRGGQFPYRRGIVLADQAWYAEGFAVANNPVIAVGGPPVNKLSDEFNKWIAPPPSKEGKYPIPGTGTRIGFFRKNPAGLPQVGLWGHNANATRETVEHYFKNEQGLTEFLKMCWKQP